MIHLALIWLSFGGLVYAVNAGLKIRLSVSPLFSICFIGFTLYFFALSGQLKLGANLLIGSGLVACLFFIKAFWTGDVERKSVLRAALPCVLMTVLCYVLTLDMAFTVIDDFVYWGIMGKYLYLHDQLPGLGNPLDVRILGYTPGTGLVHYYFYRLFGEYSVDISYFAQNFILISALLVVAQKRDLNRSMVYVGTLILILTIFCGSVFAKLQVDYLLSMLLFAIFYLYCTEEDPIRKLLSVSMPIWFLFLVKEIGFVIGLIAVVIMLLDTLMTTPSIKNEKVKTITGLFIIAGVLVTLKLMWANHIHAMGFVELHNGIHYESIKETLNVFGDKTIRTGAFIVLKELFFGSADRLNLPYILWYLGVGFLWTRLMLDQHPDMRSRFFLFTGMVFLSSLLYLFLLYTLQIIMFKVGSLNMNTVGFSRYWNILFTPLLLMVVFSFFHRILFIHRQISKKVMLSMTLLVLLVISVSRIEVHMHRESEYLQISNFSKQIEKSLAPGIHTIGIISRSGKQTAGLQFLYHLLPQQVDYKIRKIKTESDLGRYVEKYDYLIVYHPDPMHLEWLAKWVKTGGTPGTLDLLRRLEPDPGSVSTPDHFFKREAILDPSIKDIK